MFLWCPLLARRPEGDTIKTWCPLLYSPWHAGPDPSKVRPAMGLTYRGAGVDIDEGDALVERIKPHARRTMRPEVLAGIGGFGGLFEIPKGYREPVLVAGTDGVGTKLKLAFTSGGHETVGIDLVAMCENCVGVVEKSRILNGSRVRAGDVVLGLASSGLHSNGYSLARKVFGDRPAGDLLDLLLEPTRIYVKDCLALRAAIDVHAFAHVTGGGLPGNLPRVLPPEHRAVLRPGSWPRPRIFELLQKTAKIDDAEMLRTFNCGVGMCAVVRREDAAAARDLLLARGQPAWEIGVIEAAPGLAEPEVVFR